MSKDSLPSPTASKIDSLSTQKVPSWKTRPLLINQAVQRSFESKSTDDMHRNKSERCDSTSPSTTIKSLSNSLPSVHKAASDVSISNITFTMANQQQTGDTEEK